MWNPPQTGIKPISPALAGRLLSTVPLGKSLWNMEFLRTIEMKEEILNMWVTSTCVHKITFDLSRTRFGGRWQKTKMTASETGNWLWTWICVCLAAQSRPPGGLPNRGIELGSPAEQAGFFTSWAIRESQGESWVKLSFCLVVRG